MNTLSHGRATVERLLVEQYDTCEKQPYHLGSIEFYYCTILNQMIKLILTPTQQEHHLVGQNKSVTLFVVT